MILVTGGLGMIGAHTAAALADLGEEALVTGHRRSDAPSFFGERVAVEIVDLADRAAFLALGDRYPISSIVHLASSIPEPDPIEFYRRDATVLFNALEAARIWRVDRFAVASSISVYTGRPEIPYREDLALPLADIPHAIGAFKKAVEPLVRFALAGTDAQPVLLRIGSTWGPLMDPESPFSPVPRTVSALLRGERPPALRAEDGGDFGYAPDTGRAIALLMTAPALAHTVYNVGSGFPVTGGQIARALNAVLPAPGVALVDHRSTLDGEHPYLDISRLKTDTGFEPQYDPAAAVAHYVSWRRMTPR